MPKYTPPCVDENSTQYDACGNTVEGTTQLSSLEADRIESGLNRAYNDNFILVFDTPGILKNYETTAGQRSCGLITPDKVQFNITAANIPTVEVPAKKLPYSGHTFKVSSHSKADFIPLKVDFFIDKKWDNYWLLWKWLNILSDEEHGFFDQAPDLGRTPSKGIPAEYMTTMSMILLDSYKAPVIQFDYHNCFITGLDAVQLNYQQENEIPCGATFEYSRFDAMLI